MFLNNSYNYLLFTKYSRDVLKMQVNVPPTH